MIPCISGPLVGLSLFSATADQRALLGEDVFLRTHMPLTFQRYRAGVAPAKWTESTLLSKLADQQGVARGNRLFLLYGAAGAGKSETLRWLHMQLKRQEPNRAKAMIRVPRTALDPVLIVDTILRHFGESGLTSQLDRWNSLKQKPVSLANQVIWGALGDMLSSDDQIIPLSYKLRPVVESNLRKGIATLAKPEETSSPVELLTREQLRNALIESALNIDLPYEPLLACMREELDQALLGDVRLVPTLRRLSEMAREEWGVRPILLIDDLVQSLNVYASDLLDYFLTLEEGDWDVVIGLTPASFEGAERTRELLQRINQLDTVDDRVTRLFLSDVRGDDSAFLHSETLGEFLEAYLKEFKRMQGYECDRGCPGFAACTALQLSQRTDTALAPFNPALLRRMFRRLPKGKGKPRYLLMTVAELLQSAAAGFPSLLSGLQDYAEREHFAITADPRVKTFVELYVPEGAQEEAGVVLPPEIHRLIGCPTDAVPVTVQPLLVSGQPLTATQPAPPDIDPDAEAVRDWLEGKLVNPELLKPLRLSIARWLRELGDPGRISGEGATRPTGILRWSVQTQDCDLPIAFEGVDQEDGILVSRELGPVAFDLLRYSKATGKAKEQVLARIFASTATYELGLRAQAWNKARVRELVEAVNMPLAALAHHMLTVVVTLGLLPTEDWSPTYLNRLPATAAAYLPALTLSRRELEWISGFWSDEYRIRDNVFRGKHLRDLPPCNPDESIAALLGINGEAVPYGFAFGSARLKDFIAGFQERLSTLESVMTDPRIDTELRRFSQRLAAAQLLVDKEGLLTLRRLVYQVNQQRRLLPQLMRQQVPDLLPPRVEVSASGSGGVSHQLAHCKHPTGTGARLQALSSALEHFSGPGAVVEEWMTRVEQTHHMIRGWVDPNESRQNQTVAYQPDRMLRQILTDLRFLQRKASPSLTQRESSGGRWKERLGILECLLPDRSHVRREYRAVWHKLTSRGGSNADWSLLETTLFRVTNYWRLAALVASERGMREGTEVLQALTMIARGNEAPANLPTLCAKLAAQFEEASNSGVLGVLTRGSAPPTLHDLSYGDLLELKTRYPELTRGLVLHAAES